MQFIKPDVNINFIGIRKTAFILSLALVIISIISLIAHKGPRYGVDFEGGLSIQIKFQGQVSLADIEKGMATLGIENASVQRFGVPTDNEFQIRGPLSVLKKTAQATPSESTADVSSAPPETTGTDAPATDGKTGDGAKAAEAAAPAAPKAQGGVDLENLTEAMKSALKTSTGVDVVDASVEMVGPQASKDLREKALLAIFFSLLLLEIYISGRFELKWTLSALMAGAIGIPVYFIIQFDLGMGLTFIIFLALAISLVFCWLLKLKYALGAIVALIHDVTITVGVFSLLNIEITLQIVAALLTIIGYSLNDTIIVYDRIRENIAKDNKAPMPQIINRSINETLSRTTLTSLLTLLVVVALYALGGSVIHHFAFAMIIGIVVGTYSSIYVASPILIGWKDEN
jgi:preprotein translocase subunit SecF